jgi:magnesium transporter
MDVKIITGQLRDHLVDIIEQKSARAKQIWQAFCEIHPVDIADFIDDIDQIYQHSLYLLLPTELRYDVFIELSDSSKSTVLEQMGNQEVAETLAFLAPDELTDLFDLLSDETLKKYLSLLNNKVRQQVTSLLKFDPESAGGVMHTDVITLMPGFTVERAAKLLQRLQPEREIHSQIFVTNEQHQLIGTVHLADLVLQKPETKIDRFMEKNELVVKADEDQESVAKKMRHYGQMIAPVVDDVNHFLGVIPSETLLDVIVEEASEDVQRMAALKPMKESYFKAPFKQVLYERGSILVILMLFESVSGIILGAYEGMLSSSVVLYSFIPMLMSMGGNTSHQTSTVVIQGIALGDVQTDNMKAFLKREFTMAACLALILGTTAFARAIMTGGSWLQGFAISLSATIIALASVSLGSFMPLVLKRVGIDPAFSAGPFLSTFMDVAGVLIYCTVVKLILF